MLKKLLILSSVLLGLSGVAFADDDGPSERRVMDFEADTLTADFLKPGTMVIEGVARGRRSSLIEVRLDFVDEIMRSADEI